MSSNEPPIYYFSNIDFNSSFFDSTSISISKANSLYLRKTVPDTATSLETFSGGISFPTTVTNFDQTVTTTATVTASNTGNNGRYWQIGGIKYMTGNMRLTFNSSASYSGIVTITLPTWFSTLFITQYGSNITSNTGNPQYCCTTLMSTSQFNFVMHLDTPATVGNYYGVNYMITGI